MKQTDIWPLLEMEGIEDDEYTGNFEITIGGGDDDDRRLIHSKKTTGQGKVETTSEREGLVELIKEYLDDHDLLP